MDETQSGVISQSIRLKQYVYSDGTRIDLHLLFGLRAYLMQIQCRSEHVMGENRSHALWASATPSAIMSITTAAVWEYAAILVDTG